MFSAALLLSGFSVGILLACACLWLGDWYVTRQELKARNRALVVENIYLRLGRAQRGPDLRVGT